MTTPPPGTAGVVTLIVQPDQTRSFWSAWATPEDQIPHLAQWVAWADEHGHRLSIATWLAYADTYPGTLARAEVTGPVEDLGYRYTLSLHEQSSGMLLQVYEVSAAAPDTAGAPVLALTRATLFGVAARICEQQAQQVVEPGHDGSCGVDADAWLRQAAAFRTRHESMPVAALAATLRASFHQARFDAPVAAIEIAGVWVCTRIDRHGTVQVSVQLDEAQPWLRRADGTAALNLSVQDVTVFTD
jgi:hypothetical protein